MLALELLDCGGLRGINPCERRMGWRTGYGTSRLPCSLAAFRGHLTNLLVSCPLSGDAHVNAAMVATATPKQRMRKGSRSTKTVASVALAWPVAV